MNNIVQDIEDGQTQDRQALDLCLDALLADSNFGVTTNATVQRARAEKAEEVAWEVRAMYDSRRDEILRLAHEMERAATWLEDGQDPPRYAAEMLRAALAGGSAGVSVGRAGEAPDAKGDPRKGCE